MTDRNYEDYRRVDPRLFRPRADYLLKVRGDSMRDVGILDGDLLAVHQTPTAHNGQIVVARVDDEITVKRLEQQGDIVLLKPENSSYQPIRIDLREQELTIEGIYAGLLRPGTEIS
jgi:repressor LexA